MDVKRHFQYYPNHIVQLCGD